MERNMDLKEVINTTVSNAVNQGKKKHKVRFSLVRFIEVLLCISIVMLGLSIYAYKNRDAIHEQIADKLIEETEQNSKKSDSKKDEVKALPAELTAPDSLTVLVTKSYTLAASYTPKNLQTPYLPSTAGQIKLRKEAGDAAKNMITKAKADGVTLLVTAGYRSYEDQETMYTSTVTNLGGEAVASRTQSKAGASEHQTGLAIDFTDNKNKSAETKDFGKTKAGQWLFQHAHEYGFILRYPEGKEKVTGYDYSPWHYRYVGKDLATKIWSKSADHNETMEEYYNING